MAKKDFSKAAASVFVNKMTTAEEQQPSTSVKSNVHEIATTLAKRVKVPEERITMIIESSAVEKMRAIAWQDKRKLKEVFADAMKMYLTDYEEKNGKIKTR